MFEKTKYINEIFELIAYGTAKLSVIFLYRRIFANNTFRLITTMAITIVTGWLISFFFVIVFQCTPIASQWQNLEIMNQKNCVSQQPFYYANSITDLLTDLMVLVLPLPMVARLQMPIKQKLAVTGMFLLGSLVCATSAARLGVFVEHLPRFAEHLNDITYYNAPLGLWSLIEASLSVVSACLPSLRPLFNSSSRRKTTYVQHVSLRTGTDGSKGREPRTNDSDLEDKSYYSGGRSEKHSAPYVQDSSASSQSPKLPSPPARRKDEDEYWRVKPCPTPIDDDNGSIQTSHLSLPIMRPPSTVSRLSTTAIKTKISALGSSTPRRAPLSPPCHPLLASTGSVSSMYGHRTVHDTYPRVFPLSLQHPRPAPPTPQYVQMREQAASVSALASAGPPRAWYEGSRFVRTVGAPTRSHGK